MSGILCPYCNMMMALDSATRIIEHFCFDRQNSFLIRGSNNIPESTLSITFYRCPNCGEYMITTKGIGSAISDVDLTIRPISSAIHYPDYIPRQIREDYEEAYAILKLSPKASATLSRRCLQGMIRDFWGVSRSRLYDEISELKDKIDPNLWNAIDSLRCLGNIGAHMEKDVNLIIDIDSEEAEKLVKLIELLMNEWYINRENRNTLFSDILKINTDKQAAKKDEG